MKYKITFHLIFIFISFFFITKTLSQSNPKAQITGDFEVSGRIKQFTLPQDSQDVVTKEYMDKMLIQFGLSMGDQGISRLLETGYSPKELIQNGISNVDTFIGRKYGGGIIVYMYPDGSGLTARTIKGQTQSWGCRSTEIPDASGTQIGDGLANTNRIDRDCGDSNFAAKLAKNYVYEGYSDWFLPSSDELIACLSIPNGNSYFNDQPSGATIFWSSSQVNATTAYGRDYNVGVDPIRIFSKVTQGTVIAMRTFN